MDDSALSVPQGWSLVPVGNLLVFKNGLNKGKAYFGYGTPIVNYMDVFGHSGLYSSNVKGLVDVTNAEKKAFSVRKGDVLFTRTSETPEEVGISSVLMSEIENAVFSGFVLRGRPVSQRLSANYAQYCFSSSAVRGQIVSSATYTTRALTNGRILSKVLLPLPDDPNEQEAIAEALSDADALIEGLERLIAKKRLIKQGAMQDLLTAKRRLPGFAGEWVETSFGQCFQFLRTGSASRSQLGTSLGVGYIHYGDIHGMNSAVLDLSRTRLPEIAPEQVVRLSRVQDGDLVIADASEDVMDVGKSVEIRGVGNAEIVAGLHTFLLRGNPEIVADGFKAYIQFLRDVRAGIESIATGSSVYGISKKNLSALKFSVPPVREQAAIGQLFADMDAEIQALETRLKKARQVKEGMMQNLLTGRIRLV